jgi:hypothetical protein
MGRNKEAQSCYYPKDQPKLFYSIPC